MTASAEFPQYQFRAPASFTRGRKPSQPTVIFMHTTEGSEGVTSAEDGAAYDARRDDGTSTHFFVDQNTTIQCVYTYDEAHAARAHGNDVGIQIEVCGKAAQTPVQWADVASAGAIEQAAKLCVAIRAKYGKARFPLVNLTPSQLRGGGRGFAEHADATKAWPEDGGTHTDPGPNFPWATLFARIAALEKPKEWDELATRDEVEQASEDGATAALTKKIPFAGGPGTRIHAAGWNDMSIVTRLDYLCEMVMAKERAPEQSGGIMARLERVEALLERLAANLPSDPA